MAFNDAEKLRFRIDQNAYNFSQKALTIQHYISANIPLTMNTMKTLLPIVFQLVFFTYMVQMISTPFSGR